DDNDDDNNNNDNNNTPLVNDPGWIRLKFHSYQAWSDGCGYELSDQNLHLKNFVKNHSGFYLKGEVNGGILWKNVQLFRQNLYSEAPVVSDSKESFTMDVKVKLKKLPGDNSNKEDVVEEGGGDDDEHDIDENVTDVDDKSNSN